MKVIIYTFGNECHDGASGCHVSSLESTGFKSFFFNMPDIHFVILPDFLQCVFYVLCFMIKLYHNRSLPDTFQSTLRSLSFHLV
jgi:hypothetical protein